MRSKVEKPQKLQKDYDDLHKEWLDYLLTGFNVLVRGRGSKVKVVESFCEKYLSEKDVLQVYGHTPGETLKSILQKIINKFKLGIKLLPSAMIKNANEVSEAIEEHKRERYLIIHNLDAPGLRDPLILEIFSILVRGKYLRLVSTLCCDCGDIYWNQELKRSMRLVDYTVKTNEYEQEEFFDLNPKLAGTKGKKTGVHTMESLDMIWTALPSNAQRIFIRLYELIQCSGEPFIQYHELLDELKKDIWTLNEHTLNQQLVEFTSHSVIDKSPEGTISFVVAPALLANFIESKHPS